MIKTKFSKDYLVNELDLPYSAAEEEIVDTSRWSIHYKIIFEDNGKYYQTYYSSGATECQDERPWEYDDEVDCTEVEKRQVMVEKWMPVEI